MIVYVCVCVWGLIVGEIISVFASGCVYVFDRVFERETETVRVREREIICVFLIILKIKPPQGL